MIITLDAEHRYRVDGIEKPGVTQILDHCGLIPEFSKNDFAAERGTAVHLAAKYLFLGMLDWSTVDDRIVEYVKSLDLFIKTTGFKALSVEQAGYSMLYGYCGTWDVTGVFANGGEIDDMQLDLKSGSPQKAHRAQTAAYQPLCMAARRGALYLQANGSLAKLVEHKDPNDWKCFYSCLKIYQGEKELEPYKENLRAWMEAA